MSNCKELWIARINHQHLKTAGKDHYLEKRDGVPQKERETYGQKEREKREGGCSAIMKKEDNSMIDVENVETTGDRCRHLS